MPKQPNPEFEIRGVNHLALTCRDMAKTVEFYRDVLGMPLTKTIDLPGGMGQHFFFDCGAGSSLAFFWWADVPPAAPGIASVKDFPREGKSAVGSMNHIAFDVAPEKFDEYCERLKAKGVKTSMVMNHDDSPHQVSREVHPGVFVRSVYFFDPDGACLEFAAWTRPMTDADVAHDPMTAEGVKATGMIVKDAAPTLQPAE